MNWLARSGVLAKYPRRRLLAASAVVLVLAGVALVWLLGQFPSDQAFEVVVENNTADTLVLGHCASTSAGPDCTRPDAEVRLVPGEQFMTRSAIGASNPFVVHDLAGMQLGCLNLEWVRRPPTTPVVYTSEVGWCPRLATQ